MSVVQASGRARPRCTPRPPAGSDGLCKRERGVFLRIVVKGGGKADKADIFAIDNHNSALCQSAHRSASPPRLDSVSLANAMAEKQDWEESKLSQVPHG